MDKAFTFYYPDSLELLEAWGAQLVPFSPLTDRKLPRGIGGIYLGGGFPELYAKQLSDNTPMRDALQLAAAQERPIYAECGGLMYLGHSLEDQQGMTHAMAGILPAHSSLKNTQLTLGYRTVCTLNDTPLMKSGETVRGHEFHLSVLKEPPQTTQAAYRVLDQTDRVEGFRVKNVLGSYIHLHLGSQSTLAPRLVDSCARWKSEHDQDLPSSVMPSAV